MGSAKAVPANTEAPAGLGSKLPVAAGDLTRPWDSLAIVAGTVAGAALACVGWWGVWKLIERKVESARTNR